MTVTDLVGALPDSPRWVEVNGMLSSGRGETVFVDPGPPISAIVVQSDTKLGAIVGFPNQSAIAEASKSITEMLAQPENADWVATALDGWRREAATLHVMEHWPPGDAGEDAIRFLEADDLASDDFTPEIRKEYEIELAAGTRVIAALSGNRPVGFCYAAVVTPTWWDVSVYTHRAFRRRGHARRAAAFEIARQASLGRRPVWGAVLSNTASLSLAAKMGFVPVDEIVLFARPQADE